jgi:hypothetical protein
VIDANRPSPITAADSLYATELGRVRAGPLVSSFTKLITAV